MTTGSDARGGGGGGEAGPCLATHSASDHLPKCSHEMEQPKQLMKALSHPGRGNSKSHIVGNWKTRTCPVAYDITLRTETVGFNVDWSIYSHMYT